jgi:UDP-N-acetylmuramate dehydrogenase
MAGLSRQDLVDLSGRFHHVAKRNLNLSVISQWRIGGVADLVLRPNSKAMLAEMLLWFTSRNLKPVVIGSTTNLLFDDAGLRVPCIQIGMGMSETRIQGQTIYAEAGLWVPSLARIAMRNSLQGLEHICGIPGSLGGLVCMNGGSNRRGIGDSISCVGVIDAYGSVRQRSAEECEFGYRHSLFQGNGDVITDVTLSLHTGRSSEIRSKMLKILKERRLKFPRRLPNCGSVFKSNPLMYSEIGPPGKVIEALGFKGRTMGGAQISWAHANFITNIGGASSSDVLQLVSIIRAAVKARTGYILESEVRYVSETGVISPV